MPDWLLSAQATQQAPQGMGFDLLWVIILMVIGYYFLIIMPQKRDKAERQKMLNQLAKGDRVITSSGIHGKVVDISKKGEIEIVTLECSRNVQIDFSRSAIGAVLKKKDEGSGSEPDSGEKGDSASKPGKAKG